MRVVAGGLRYGLPVLRDRASRADPEPVHRRDRRPGGGGGPHARGRRGAWRARPGLQRRVHGHGGAAGQLRQRAGRGAPADRTGARRHGHLPAFGHGLHGGPGTGHHTAGRRTPLGHPGCVSARPGRRTARHAGSGQPALEGGRGAGRRLGLRRDHRPPRLDRVRPDQGHQRSRLAGRPAGFAAGRAARSRQPDPAQPDTGVEVDRVAARRAARVRPPPGSARRPGHGAGHPGPRDRRRLRPASRLGFGPHPLLRPPPLPRLADEPRVLAPRAALAGGALGLPDGAARPG